MYQESVLTAWRFFCVPDESDDDDWGDSDDGEGEGDERNGVAGYQLLPQNLDQPPVDGSHGTGKMFTKITFSKWLQQLCGQASSLIKVIILLLSRL